MTIENFPIGAPILGVVSELSPCLGQYCGRILTEDGNWSSCGACPRGYRANVNTSECIKCTNSPLFYDWLFLGFMAMLSLILHWFCIDLSAKRRSFTYSVLVLHFSALVETVLAAIVTVVTAHPIGSFTLHSCPVQRLSDWYTMLHNPSPDYTYTLHCTQEAVYPLYTVVFIYYALCLFFMFLFRPLLVSRFMPGRGKAAIYAALYFLPVLVVVQAVLGGLLYYTFPYITIILSVISNATHFAFRLDQSIKSLFLTTLTDVRNVVIFLGHCALHMFGIIAITQLRDFTFHLSLLGLVPFPAIFYILTVRFTDPNKLHID